MNMEEIGRVYHYLLKHRSIESKPQLRKSRPNETLVASILRSASIDQLERFNEFLAPQGFKLVEFDDSMRGVSVAGRVWVLTRNGEIASSSFLSTERVYSEMNIRGKDSREASAVWFLHIWLIYLFLIYTKAGRGVSEVSSYVDATFSREVLEEEVVEHIAHIRQTDLNTDAASKVVAILDDEKGKDISRRVSAFLRLMSAAGLIQESEKNEYQQTLLGAHEISEHYDKSLRIPIDDTLNKIVNIVSPNDEERNVEGVTDGVD